MEKMDRKEVEELRTESRVRKVNAAMEREFGAGSLELQKTDDGIRVTYEAGCGTIDMDANPWVLHDLIYQLTIMKAEIERVGLK